MPQIRVLVADPIAEKGIQTLQEAGFEVSVRPGLSESELIEIVPDYDAIVCRSGVKITEPIFAATSRLKVVGRAGVGVDNIDIKAASKRGVVVMNTPGGNTISTAEHAITLMLSLARAIPQAHQSVVTGKWERKKYQGSEVHGKTLLILGMGRIGGEFAKRALSFGMTVLAYDPYLSAEKAQSLRVERVENLVEALPKADFITMHMPLTAETKHLLNEERIALLKPSVRIVNCARGGLIDDNALAKALNEGRVAGAAVDVYEVEPPPVDYPLLNAKNTVFTPHLGASTLEAQENVGIEIADQIRDFLERNIVVNAVNMPSVDEKTRREAGPYMAFGEMLGRLVSQLAPHPAGSLKVEYSGKLSQMDTGLITRSVLKGFLEPTLEPESVNLINAPSIAESRQLRVVESRQAANSEFNELISVTAVSSEDDTQRANVSGTYFGSTPRIVKINEHHVEAIPQGTLLVYENVDRPGMIGAVGNLLGEHQVNIANMSLSRLEAGATALTLLTLDNSPDEATLAALRQVPDILRVHKLDVNLD